MTTAPTPLVLNNQTSMCWLPRRSSYNRADNILTMGTLTFAKGTPKTWCWPLKYTQCLPSDCIHTCGTYTTGSSTFENANNTGTVDTNKHLCPQ